MIVWALLVEAAALFAAVAGRPLALVAAAHLVATAAAVVGLGGRRRDERFFVGALVLSLPVAGLAGLAVIRVWSRFVPAPVQATEHASLDTLPVPEQPRESLDEMFGWIQAELAVQPLADAIRSANPDSQRWAVNLLERRGDAAAVALLREALRATSRQTQILASSSLRRIEERLVHDIERAREGAATSPAPATWTARGDAERTLADSALVEAAGRARLLEDAATSYTAALTLAPGDAGAILGLARTRLAQDRAAEAETLVRRAAALEPAAATDLLLAEALFAQGRWADVVATCRAAADAGREHELVTWWARP
jgi:tetratricopeptide (TPR) repeat protein